MQGMKGVFGDRQDESRHGRCDADECVSSMCQVSFAIHQAATEAAAAQKTRKRTRSAEKEGAQGACPPAPGLACPLSKKPCPSHHVSSLLTSRHGSYFVWGKAAPLQRCTVLHPVQHLHAEAKQQPCQGPQ